MFLSSEYFVFFYSGFFFFSKVSYLVSYLWFFCVVVAVIWQWTKCFVCAKGDVAMSTILKVISVTGVCSSLVVATPCFVGVDAKLVVQNQIAY